MHNHANQIHYWQLQDAKARFSELVKTAITQGPQGISIRGAPEAIIISKNDYDKLIKPQKSVWQFFRDSPLVGSNLKLERDKSTDRDVDL